MLYVSGLVQQQAGLAVRHQQHQVRLGQDDRLCQAVGRKLSQHLALGQVAFQRNEIIGEKVAAGSKEVFIKHHLAAHKFLRGLALPTCEALATPLGTVPVDMPSRALLASLPQVVENDASHALEHSLEVQLPFLQTLLRDFTLVPLAVGQATPEEVAEVLEQLWGGEETLILISSDLTHFLPYELAQAEDKETVAQMLKLAPHIDHQHACGATPVNGLLLAARRHGLRPQLLDLRNSGDTEGDPSRVVGYAALAFRVPHVV